MRIRSLIEFDQCTVFGQEFVRGRCFWHNIWATIFKILDINNPIVWAKIIHVSQTLLTFYALLISGHFVFKGLLRDRNRLYLSLISACLWMTGVGTFFHANPTVLDNVVFRDLYRLLNAASDNHIRDNSESPEFSKYQKKHLFSKVEFFFFLHT